MTNSEKKIILEELLQQNNFRDEECYEALEKMEDLKIYYYDYLGTEHTNLDAELVHLEDADYNTCCSLLTMVLREGYFNNGSFEVRVEMGQVKQILEKMICCLDGKL